MSTTSFGLGFEPFPLLLDYELSEHLMLRTDATKNALFLGSHMNGEIADMSEALDEYEESGHSDEDVNAEEERLWRRLCSRLIGGASPCLHVLVGKLGSVKGRRSRRPLLRLLRSAGYHPRLGCSPPPPPEGRLTVGYLGFLLALLTKTNR